MAPAWNALQLQMYRSAQELARNVRRVRDLRNRVNAAGFRSRSDILLTPNVRAPLMLGDEGAFGVVVSPSFLETASRQGLRVREYRVPAGGRVACTVTTEDDLLVGRLQGDFRDVSRLDLVVQVEDGPEHRIEDLPISPSSPEVILAQAMPALRALGSSTIRMRLLASEPEGDRVVGEYTFAHTPSRSGTS